MDASAVEEFLEGLPVIQQAIGEKRDLSAFWTWKFAEVNGDELLTGKKDFQERLDDRLAFVREFRSQHDKIIKSLTEKILVKLPPLFDLLSKNLEMAERVLREGETSLIEKIARSVSEYLQNPSNFIPLEEKLVCADWDFNPPLLLSFTDDEDHREEAFILIRGTLSNYFISFDIIAKYFPEALVKAYAREVEKFEESNGQTIEQLLFLVKEYGPVGPLLLARLFKKNPRLTDKTFIKYSLVRNRIVHLFAEDRSPLLQASGKVCTLYDLIFSGKGILKAKDFYQVKDDDYRVVVLFEKRDCRDRDESLDRITYQGLYPFNAVMEIIRDRKFTSTWPDQARQFALPPSSEGEELLQPEKWFRPLWDFVTGLGTDNADTVTCAGYIGQYFNVRLAEDFQPYGRARIESKSLSKKLYLLEKFFQEKKPSCDRESGPLSLEYRVGSLFKGYESEDICLASLSLAYKKQKLTKPELERGEKVVEEIKRKSLEAHLSSTLPRN